MRLESLAAAVLIGILAAGCSKSPERHAPARHDAAVAVESAATQQTVKTVLPPAPPLLWWPHYAGVLEAAKKSGRDIMVFFNGSDWCRPAVQFKQDILGSNIVRASLGDLFLFLEIDHPNVMSDARKEQEKKNAGMTLWIANYPAVVLVDPDGRIYARMACGKETDPVVFVGKVKAMQAIRIARDREWALAKSASGVAKATHLGKGLDLMEMQLARQNAYRPVLEEIKKADPLDAAGYASRYGFAANGFMEGTVVRLAGEKKFEEATKEIVKKLAGPGLTIAQRQEVMAAQYRLCIAQDLKDNAASALRGLIALDPKSDIAAGATVCLNRVLNRPVEIGDRWDGSVCGQPAVWVRDVSQWVTGPGRYGVTFEPVPGGDELSIEEVVLLAGEKEIATDQHAGRARDPGSRTYVVAVDELPPNRKLTLRMTTRCGGWRNSSGRIVIARQ